MKIHHDLNIQFDSMTKYYSHDVLSLIYVEHTMKYQEVFENIQHHTQTM